MTAKKIFAQEDQLWFAVRSGDHNPLHMDAKWAGHHFPGSQVVHGMHILLWGLDILLQSKPLSLNKIQATWIKPVVLGDQVRLEWNFEATMLRVFLGREPVLVVRLETEGRLASAREFRAIGEALAAPIERDFETMAASHGMVALPAGAALLSERFSALSSSIGPQALAGLAGLSTLVGMHCPGLHSMLSEVEVTFSATAEQPALEYAVKRWMPQFSRLEIKAEGLGLEAQAHAFAGQVPRPPANELVREAVAADEFSGSSPLIIGASAGLGSITARLLAAGGARPTLTWRGSVDDLRETGGAIRTLAGQSDEVFFDILSVDKGLEALRRVSWQGQQVYFFATPRIFRRHVDLYSPADLAAFWQVYIDGFYELVTGLMAQRANRPLHIFYPSSTAVEDGTPELLEYAMAKEAGERLCQRLQQKFKHLTITVVRLPRIATRQTQTFVRVAAKTPLEVMLPIIRRVQKVSHD